MIPTSPNRISSPETIPKDVTTELGPHGSSKPCFYVPGKWQDSCSLLIDTGSSIPVLSNNVLTILGHSSDLQTVQEKVVTANGQDVNVPNPAMRYLCDIH